MAMKTGPGQIRGVIIDELETITNHTRAQHGRKRPGETGKAFRARMRAERRSKAGASA